MTTEQKLVEVIEIQGRILDLIFEMQKSINDLKEQLRIANDEIQIIKLNYVCKS